MSFTGTFLNAINLFLIKITFTFVPFAKSSDITFWRFLPYPLLSYIFHSVKQSTDEETTSFSEHSTPSTDAFFQMIIIGICFSLNFIFYASSVGYLLLT